MALFMILLIFVRGILEVEMNSATDNPMVFPADQHRPIISAGIFMASTRV